MNTKQTPLPIRRDIHFKLDKDAVTDWHIEGPEATHLMNALSIFLPVGERFFINAVRYYRDQITDPELKAAVIAFIGQEAMHGREHEDCNDALNEAGFPAEALEKRVIAILDFFKAHTSPAFQLSGTIALEHITATFADLALRDPRAVGGRKRKMSALWRWHALEETEHKAVAFDVYESVIGRGPRAYALRATGLILATAILPLLLEFQTRFARASGGKRDWLALARFTLGRPGMLRKLTLPWLDYFKPGFHPWDHDNREFLGEIDAFVESSKYEELVAA